MQKKILKGIYTFCSRWNFNVAFSSYAYNLWIGDKILITNILSFWILMYSLVTMFSSIYVTILNGMGLLKVQMYACLFSPFVFLGLCYMFVHMGLGVHALLIAVIISNFNGYLLAPIQYRIYTRHL